MKVLEVFADITCPFAYVGLVRFRELREARERSEPVLHVRAWPLELVNDEPHSGARLAPEIDALRAGVAPDLFAGFDVAHFPETSLLPLAAAAAAYRQSVEAGERFSLAVRHALFEDGLDVSDEDVLTTLCASLGVPSPTPADHAVIGDEYAAGQRQQVPGSPYFITPDGGFFCPSLDVEHDAGGFTVTFDPEGFDQFVAATLG